MADGSAGAAGAVDMEGPRRTTAGSGSVARAQAFVEDIRLTSAQAPSNTLAGALSPAETSPDGPRRGAEAAVVAVEHEPAVREDEVRRQVVGDLLDVLVRRQLPVRLPRAQV